MLIAQTQCRNIEQLFKSSDSLKFKNHRLILTFFEIFNMFTICTESDKSSFNKTFNSVRNKHLRHVEQKGLIMHANKVIRRENDEVTPRFTSTTL